MELEKLAIGPAYDDEWAKAAEKIARGLFKLLAENGFRKAALFEVLSDVVGLARLEELEGILGRPALPEESRQFTALIEASVPFAVKKRRLLVRSLDDFRLRVQLPQTPTFSTRELLVLKSTKAQSSAFPTASARNVRTKEDKRKVLALKVGSIISLCNFPAAQLMAESTNPERLQAKFAAGRRLSTLTEKVRIFGKLNLWMTANCAKEFPTKEIEVIDFLLDQADIPCGPSFPAAVLGATTWFEKIGGVPLQLCLGSAGTVRGVVDELKLQLSSDKPRAKRKALSNSLQCLFLWKPRFPTKHCLSTSVSLPGRSW